MKLQATYIKNTPTPGDPNHIDVFFAVSGPGAAGTANITIDTTLVQLNPNNQNFITDLFSTETTAEVVAEANTQAVVAANEANANAAAAAEQLAAAAAAQAAQEAADAAAAAQAQETAQQEADAVAAQAAADAAAGKDEAPTV